jgi:hypothetical protein
MTGLRRVKCALDLDHFLRENDPDLSSVCFKLDFPKKWYPFYRISL